ncbi:MAG: gamma-glutamyltransferase, partial [Pseudomonadota bacterium]
VEIDRKQKQENAVKGFLIDFLPKANANQTAIPMMVRGLTVMHAQFGILEWRLMLADSERYARFGYELSRASRNHWQNLLQKNYHSSLLRFGQIAHGGRNPFISQQEIGSLVQQPTLASILGQVRARGGGVLYIGSLANQVAQIYQENGLMLDPQTLREALPKVSQLEGVSLGNDVLYTTHIARRLLPLIVEDINQHQSDWHQVAFDTNLQTAWFSKAGFDPRFELSVHDHKGVSVSASDGWGLSVACRLTNGQAPFRFIERLGFVIGAPLNDAQMEWNHSDIAVLVNQNTNSFHWLGVGEGSLIDYAVLGGLLEGALQRDLDIKARIEQKRIIFNPLSPNLDLVETDDVSFGGVQSIYCPRGIPSNEDTALCFVETDARNAGLGQSLSVF